MTRITDYFELVSDLKDIFTKKKLRFVYSVYIYGSFARDQIIPGLSDIDVMIFIKKNSLSVSEIKMIRQINTHLLEKYKIHMVFRIHNIQELYENKLRSDDLLYPFLYDLILHGFTIYGANIDLKLMGCLKKINYDLYVSEFITVRSMLRNEIFVGFANKDNYKLGDAIFDYYRLLTLWKDVKLDLNQEIKLISKSLRYYKSIFKKIDSEYDFVDLETVFDKNQKLTILLGTAIGAILYNPKLEKILILENSFGGGGWWGYPKGGLHKNESMTNCLLREIKEETNLSDVSILYYLGFINHKYMKDSFTLRKTTTYYYLVYTNDRNIVISDEHNNFKWVTKNQANKFIKANNLKFVLNKGMDLI